MFLWTRRMQFWQLCHEIFRKTLQNFLSMSENDTKIVISTKKNNWLHNLPLITYKAVLTILLTIFFPKAVVFSHFARNWWKQKFCRNVSRKFFRTFHLSSAQVGCIFTASSKTFCQKPEIYLFNIRKWRNNEPSSAEFFYSKRFVWSGTTDFWKFLRKKNLSRKPKFFARRSKRIK